MIRLLNLIQNENMKIYSRLRTWILVAILIGLMSTISIVMKATDTRSGDNWQEGAKSRIEQNERILNNSKDLPGFAKEEVERSILVDKYRLEHDIPPADDTVWGIVLQLSILIILVTLFTVVIAADIVAGEFATGTIKLLLIRPASRSKILLSKYLATILFSLLLLVLLFVSTFVLNGFLHGFSDVGTPYVYAGKDMVARESSMLLHALSTYALKCVELVMIVTLAFMISTVFRSSNLAIGLSLLLLFLGQGVTLFLARWSWGKYWLFANTDLTQYIEGKPLFEGMNMAFSIAVLAAYFLLFNFLSWSIFKKRDVAA